MQFKPTAAAAAIARRNGTLAALVRAAGERSHIASNRSDHGHGASKHLVRAVRQACGIPAGVPLFTAAGPAGEE